MKHHLTYPTPNPAEYIQISEVADKGSSGTCGGQDWIELVNLAPVDIDLSSG